MDKNKFIVQETFAMEHDQDTLLPKLDFLLKTTKQTLKNVKGLVLLVSSSSLTQVKLATAMINTLGWQLAVPVVGDYDYQGELSLDLEKILKKISSVKKFKALSAIYSRPAEITISKKQNKFQIVK